MKVKNILISQPKPTTEKSPYFDIEARYGVRMHFHQFIRVEELTPREFRAQHINILDYSAIIFSSRLGIDHFFHLCEEMRVTIPDSMHYYCVSESIANYLQKYIQYRKRKVFFAAGNNIAGLVPLMLRRPNDKFLMAVADVYNDDIIKMFADHKIVVKPAVMYRTVTNIFTPEERMDYDMYVLFTPTGVAGFKQNYPNFQQGEHIMACFGANTAQAMKDAGLRIDVQAPSPEYPSIIAAIDAFLKENHKRIR
ncbi:MAG: uroporphyrinogen-III synthase [Paludibacter sp.]|nr:uroporphyrinogen-III synthase [Bacteroidales bacterium]MCM1068668.1 uroporphyrinogen-III synthase [Prevotella sp.]MCM1353332.1 uroporphyrinogen-III synthase [Bacteroides sp.]MCM1442260.1 uroporphyrinogen-III synthase [Muribaculum sp.]MCM1481079.1 uroporphyrinogen-III synthase [Paludibacter sp.]